MCGDFEEENVPALPQPATTFLHSTCPTYNLGCLSPLKTDIDYPNVNTL